MIDDAQINQPDPEAARQRLVQVRHGLLRLHKALLDGERQDYERQYGRVESTYEFFGLVTKHPRFDWLHQLSELIVQIDESLDAKHQMSAGAAAELIDRTRSLLRPSEMGEGFERKYYDALQRDPEIVLAHAQVSQLLAADS